ncbi:DUF3710 domain-containing protein [Kineococcus sp. NUM-3379]
MSIFRRRRSGDAGEATGAPEGKVAEEAAAAADTDAGTGADPGAGSEAEAVESPAQAPAPAFDRSGGPFDVSEVEGPDGRLPLGSLWLRGRDGMEVRVDIDAEQNRPVAVTIGLDGSAVQLQAFAAPRTLGLWDEIRAEIAESVAAQGGSADEVPGTLGRELLARLPVRTPDGRTGHQPTRFAGIDGPRWFLRAVFTGPAAHDLAAAEELEALLKDTVVVRGSEAMAPRELLPLVLPEVGPGPQEDGQAGAAQAGAEEAGPQRDPLQPFERGPEITEVR